jgi:hypothetical protein
LLYGTARLLAALSYSGDLNMQYHFDSEIRLLQETESSLYPWSLQEFSKEGKALSSKLVPWKWTLDFRATELKYMRGFQSSNARFSQAGELIRITLKPEPDFSSLHTPKYSLFGTNRIIQDFSLNIYKLQDEQAEEKCTAWGAVSFTHEIDGDSRTENDLLAFRIDLKPENYDVLCYFAKHGGNRDQLLLSVTGVSGFYAEWSPLISTNNIKILATDTEQNVIQPEGSDEPPRLGEISEFKLDLSRRTPLGIPPAEKDIVATANSAPLSQPADDAALLPVIQQLQSTLKRLRIPIWLIVVLLALILSR